MQITCNACRDAAYAFAAFALLCLKGPRMNHSAARKLQKIGNAAKESEDVRLSDLCRLTQTFQGEEGLWEWTINLGAKNVPLAHKGSHNRRPHTKRQFAILNLPDLTLLSLAMTLKVAHVTLSATLLTQGWQISQALEQICHPPWISQDLSTSDR